MLVLSQVGFVVVLVGDVSNKQEVGSFPPVFVPLAADFLWEESCAFCSKGKKAIRNGKERGCESWRKGAEGALKQSMGRGGNTMFLLW